MSKIWKKVSLPTKAALSLAFPRIELLMMDVLPLLMHQAPTCPASVIIIIRTEQGTAATPLAIPCVQADAAVSLSCPGRPFQPGMCFSSLSCALRYEETL